MAKMSREKGKRGERELAGKLKEYGFDCRRGQQYCGADGSADVVGLPGIHIECKRTERLDLYGAMSQAKADSREGEVPAVFHRRNHCGWLVVMELEDWVRLYGESGFVETEKVCRTCQYGKLDELMDRYCVNSDSPNCTDWVEDKDKCCFWTEAHQ